MNNLLLVFAQTKKGKKVKYCFFNKAEMYYDFSFEKFLKAIESGVIMFDIRLGVYSSGKNYGKTHDHGSGFRIKGKDIGQIYKSFEEL